MDYFAPPLNPALAEINVKNRTQTELQNQVNNANENSSIGQISIDNTSQAYDTTDKPLTQILEFVPMEIPKRRRYVGMGLIVLLIVLFLFHSG